MWFVGINFHKVFQSDLNFKLSKTRVGLPVWQCSLKFKTVVRKQMLKEITVRTLFHSHFIHLSFWFLPLSILHLFILPPTFCLISFPLSVDLWIKHPGTPGMCLPSAWEKETVISDITSWHCMCGHSVTVTMHVCQPE